MGSFWNTPACLLQGLVLTLGLSFVLAAHFGPKDWEGWSLGPPKVFLCVSLQAVQNYSPPAVCIGSGSKSYTRSKMKIAWVFLEGLCLPSWTPPVWTLSMPLLSYMSGQSSALDCAFIFGQLSRFFLVSGGWKERLKNAHLQLIWKLIFSTWEKMY